MLPSWVNDLVLLSRTTRDLRGFLRTPITSEQAVQIVRRRLAMREERFLQICRQAIYGQPSSPYLPLLKAAGIEFGDLQSLVAKEGLERTLSMKLGRPPVAWYHPVRPLPWKTEVGSRYLATLAHLLGSRLPTPTFLDLQHADQMAAWLAGLLHKRESVCVTTYASGAVRIADAAKQRGLNLDGLCFITPRRALHRRQAADDPGGRGAGARSLRVH